MILTSMLIPLAGALLLSLLKIKGRVALCTSVIITELACAASVLVMAIRGSAETLTLFSISETMRVSFTPDKLSIVTSLLVGFGWLLCSVFAAVYMKHEVRERSFYVFMLLSQAFCLGVMLADNLMSLYFMFEATTLCSMPLVLHNRKKESIRAAKSYLLYSVGGAFLALLGIALIYKTCPQLDFCLGGNIEGEIASSALMGCLCTVVGFGAKAGMLPLHAWLPAAHPVAPAPASALLSGLITKSGVIGIIRVLFFVVGIHNLRSTYVQNILLGLSLATVLMGSVLAYRESDLKKRLAYSSVSQISYVLCGLFVLNETAYTGAILQIIFHAAVKIALFLAAGALIFLTNKKSVDDYVGVGKKYPITMWCFTLASLSLIGIPPFGGFFSKWFISVGALEGLSGPMAYAVPIVLLISALFTAGYLLPVSVKAFFPANGQSYKREKEPLGFVLPLLLLSAASLLGGLFIPTVLQLIS